MANNLAILDGAGASKTIKSTDNTSVHTPHHNIEIAGFTPSVNAGNRDAGTQRVVLASDDVSMVAMLAKLTGMQPAASTYQLLSTAATTNATSVKTTAATLHRMVGVSKRASDCWLKLYNKASAPSVGTDSPILTINIPA